MVTHQAQSCPRHVIRLNPGHTHEWVSHMLMLYNDNVLEWVNSLGSFTHAHVIQRKPRRASHKLMLYNGKMLEWMYTLGRFRYSHAIQMTTCMDGTFHISSCYTMETCINGYIPWDVSHILLLYSFTSYSA